MSYPVSRVVCRHEYCDASYPAHRHGSIRANAQGWFSERWSGNSWCPEHTPPWVAEWRAKKTKKETP